MNKVILMGRLTRDPETRLSQGPDGNSMTISRFSLAVNRRYQGNGDISADFFNCTAFGKLGDFVEKYLQKGTKVVVIGRMQNDNYTNKEGQKVFSIQIIAEEIEFAESKNASAPGAEAPGTGSQSQSADFMNIPDGIDDLPFK